MIFNRTHSGKTNAESILITFAAFGSSAIMLTLMQAPFNLAGFAWV